jgi:tetratricopeptide (TPR) repeat protein
MPTKLSILCERVIEAGWLTALVAVPLYFNVHSSRIFEPDKVALLRSIALVMALAWLVKGLEGAKLQKKTLDVRPTPSRGQALHGYDRENFAQASSEARHSREKGDARLDKPAVAPDRRFHGPGRPQVHGHSREGGNPEKNQRIRAPKFVLLLAFFFFVDYVLATATSVAPRLSLWGSYERLQGLYTTSAYLVIFFSVAALLRTREQLERLLTTVLIVSFPVSLYGVLQACGVDPLPWKENVTQRVTSTMGNPIFVAAFLIMIAPLTLYRLGETGRQVMSDVRRPGMPSRHERLRLFLRLVAYCFLLSAQLACSVLSQSRGPWLGLMVGLLLFAVLWLLAYGRRRWVVWLLGSGVVAALLLAVISMPNSPLSFVREVPYLGRFSRVFERTGQVRILIWQGVVQLVSADPLRAVVGYGPETMFVVYSPHYPPELAQVEGRTALPDRSHNETFDTLVTTGFIGLTIHLCIFTCLFSLGLRQIGLMRSVGQRNLFLGFWLGGGVGATLLSRLLDHSWRFGGVAFPLGLLGGAFAYLGWIGLTSGQTQKQQAESDSAPYLLAAPLLAAIAAHFTETTFGIAVAPTRAYFWIYAALLIVAGRIWVPSPLAGEGQEGGRGNLQAQAARKRPELGLRRALSLWSRPLIVHSVLVSFVLMTMVYAFFSPQLEKTRFLSVLGLFVLTWAFAGLIILTETEPGRANTRFAPTKELAADWSIALRRCGVYAGISLFGAFTFAAIHEGVLLLGSDPAFIPAPYYAFVLLAILAIGGALLRGERLPARLVAGTRGLLYPGLAAVAILIIVKTNLDIVRADIYYRQAWLAYNVKKQTDLAVALGRRALALTPSEDFYFLFLADVLIEKAKQSTPSEERERFFLEAEQALVRARLLNPLKFDHTAGLARLHQIWMQYASAPAGRRDHFQRSLSFYQQAVDLNPNLAHLWNEWGATYFFMGETEKALEKYRRSLALDDTFVQTYLHLGAVYTARRQWAEAAKAYEEAVARHPDSIEGQKALGAVYGMMGRLDEAVERFQRVLALTPDDWESHRTLAQVYQLRNDVDRALDHAQRALTTAPPNERAFLEALIARLRQQQGSSGR